MSSEIEKAVQKATDSKTTAPKRKHVRTIVIESWNENSARTFFLEISKRPLDTSDLVCFKALTTVHKVIQEGPRQALVDGYYRLPWVDAIKEHWNRQIDRGYGHLCAEYGAFLHDKILFHHRHTEFDGDISLEKFLKNHKLDSFEMEKLVDLVSHLLDLQEAVFKMQNVIIEPRNVNECKAGALIPLVSESYAIYTTVTYFLTKMVEKVDNMDILQFLIERYYGQYMTLRDFYINANAIRSVSSVIAVPNLPPDPPKFTVKKKSEPKQRTRARNTPTTPRRELPAAAPTPAPAPVPVQQVQQIQQLPQQQELLNLSNDAWGSFVSAPPVPAPAPVPVYPQMIVPMAISSVPPPTINTTATIPSQPSSQWVTFKSSPEQLKRPADPFSALVSMASSPSTTATTTANRLRAQTQPSSPTPPSISPSPPPKPPTPPPIVETPPPPKPPTPPPPTTSSSSTTNTTVAPQQVGIEKTRVVTKIITKTVNNVGEINKLKARIEELERELERQIEMNRELSGKLDERSAYAVERENLRHQMQVVYEEVEREKEKLRAELDALLDAQEKERWDRAVKELSAAKEAVEMYLAQLYSPTNLGNQEATSALVIEDAASLRHSATRLVDLCCNVPDADNESINQQDLFAAVNAVSNALKTLFLDTKGASRLVDDLEVRQRFLESARIVGSLTGLLLDAVCSQGGQPEGDEEKQVLKDGLDKISKSVDEVVAASLAAAQAQQQVHEQQEQQQQQQQPNGDHQEAPIDQSGIDLDDLAERELRSAAKIIEEAAKSLMAAKAAKPPKPESANGVPDVADAILEAAMAIAGATSTLVASAATAQRERAERGKAIAATGAPYRRDPTWAEGLISAAKSVAHATAALVGVANDAVQNKTEAGGEEGIIAVSKAVAAATSQLVAAARAKSEVNSPTQEKLSQAAHAVSHATSLLVAAARAAAAKEEKEVEVDYSKMSATGYKVKEMEQTMLILRLEKELEKARKGLASMRKAEYARTQVQ